MKQRFAFATVDLSNGVESELTIVRRHTSPVNAKRYAEGRHAESESAGTDKEYGLLVRTTTKNGVFDSAVDYIPSSVGAEASSKRNGKKRFPAITVELDGGKIVNVVKLHTSPKNAFHFATGANAEAAGSTEYAVILRTKDGEFPTIKAAATV